MIQANELRLNNLIMYGNMIYPVERITETSISVRLSSQSLRTAKPHEFEPVPLSTDILEACGFEYIKEKAKESKQIAEGYRLGSFFLQPDDKNRWIVDWLNFGAIHQRIYMREISFVHELQNLFFAIIGNELTINLEKVKV